MISAVASELFDKSNIFNFQLNEFCAVSLSHNKAKMFPINDLPNKVAQYVPLGSSGLSNIYILGIIHLWWEC